MVQRYGMDRRSTGSTIGAILAICAFAAALAWVTMALGRASVDASVRTWMDLGDHVDVTFTVASRSDEPVTCVLRAQDRTHADVGYAVVPVGPANPAVTVTYPLRTLAPAAAVEVLGCASESDLQVIDPQFPPGVVPPDQPWTPTG